MVEGKETIGQYVGKLEKENKLLKKKLKAFETVKKAQSKMIEELDVIIQNLIEENEHLKKSQEWHDVSILPRKEGDYLCEFSIGVFNYRHFWLPDIWGIDDEKIVKWQGEL